MSTEPEITGGQFSPAEVNDWVSQFREQEAKAAANRNRRLRLACDYLKDHDVNYFVIKYSGYGDSGGVEDLIVLSTAPEYPGSVDPSDMTAADKAKLEKLLALPLPEEVKALSAGFYGYSPETNLATWIGDTLEELAPGGYEINEGGQGTITLDVQTRQVSAVNEANIIHVETDSFDIDLSEEHTDANVQS